MVFSNPFCITLSVGSDSRGKGAKFREFFYSGFKSIEKFVSVEATVEGSAEEVGLRAADLTDFLKLRFKNAFAGIKIEAPSKPRILWDAGMAAKFGAIHLRVFTVGDDYPVAYYIAINAGNFSNRKEYEADYLGFCHKSKIPTTVKELVSELMDNLAIAFFKARGSM